ncbi:unnamed protein product [Rotaria sp. Silwood1]|nr:unnamed protein product [Rotaria sp. Silwood1]CAF1489633.1 unnamed protein product [Rotaria sp. Silwood1]CAF3597672.1 unnamed protein product [Rotaria sp. Silwood1]CAF4844617.1 unnamed protein product [Rotaria sp. Silwood1]
MINVERETHKIPGISLAVLQRGKIIFGKGYGYSNIEHKVPVKLETIFQSGSIGKQFTAMAIMILVEKEVIDLDDKIQKYFTDAPIEWNNITIRHLLTHTSGMAGYSADFNLHFDYTNDDIYRLIQKSPLTFQPGEQWAYSNFGYVMLGFLIDRVTNQFYGDFLRENVFNPLGMNTAQIINETEIVPNRASGYILVNGEIKNHEWVSPIFNTLADGSLYLNIYDMAKWDEALYTNQLLKMKTSFDAMWSPVKLNNNTTYPYGFGWWLLEAINGMRILEHGGSWQGFRSMIVRVPENEITVVLFTNLNSPTVDVRRIARRVLEINNPQLVVKPAINRIQ